jgi:hypothetical protein
VRTHRAELIQCGALCRIGRNLTIIGEGYATFLACKMGRVADYEIAPNRAARRARAKHCAPSGGD